MGEYFVGNLLFIVVAVSLLSFVVVRFASEIIRLMARGVLGVVSIFVLNIFFSPFNIAVGINVLTGLLSAFLGLPAVVLMFGLALLFR